MPYNRLVCLNYVINVFAFVICCIFHRSETLKIVIGKPLHLHTSSFSMLNFTYQVLLTYVQVCCLL